LDSFLFELLNVPNVFILQCVPVDGNDISN
jgi:hypothetical protein